MSQRRTNALYPEDLTWKYVERPKNQEDELSRFIRTGTIKKEFELQAFTPEELRTLFGNAGLKVIRIIGKPILTQLIPRDKREVLIRENFGKILNLELQFCDTQSLIGIGGHLEIVGIKNGS